MTTEDDQPTDAAAPAERPDDDAIRALVTRLGRPHRSGGRVIERATLMAEGADFTAVMAWIEAHGGEAEHCRPVALPARPAQPAPEHGRRRRQPAAALRRARRRAQRAGDDLRPRGQEDHMTDPTPPAPRGDAAWRAAKNAVNKRNEAAQKAGAARRAVKDAEAVERRQAADRHDMANLPQQPEA
jgi:hypothetical protein